MLAVRAAGFNAAAAGRIASIRPARGTAFDSGGPLLAPCP